MLARAVCVSESEGPDRRRRRLNGAYDLFFRMSYLREIAEEGSRNPRQGTNHVNSRAREDPLQRCSPTHPATGAPPDGPGRKRRQQ